MDFIQAVEPALRRGDPSELQAMFQQRWTSAQLAGLLAGDNTDAKKLAVLAMGMAGGRCCIAALAEQLRDPCPVLNQVAEHALWSIWFRLGRPEANHLLCRGTQAMNRRDFEGAINHFSRAIAIDCELAEAYHQRALAHYLLDRHRDSIVDARRAIRRMSCHFGAWAQIGHCRAHLGELDKAIEAYEQALAINPHLDCVRQALRELGSAAGQELSA